MEKKCHIRAATENDIPTLLKLRSQYVITNYGGILSKEDEQVRRRDEPIPEIGEWVHVGDNYNVAVMENSERIVGFIVYGPDGEDGCGVILEARAEYPSDAEGKR